MLKKYFCTSLVSTTLCCTAATAYASLDLLAGVEAGIDTDTAMMTSDLEQTQRILSTEQIGNHYHWLNKVTGTAYEITIDHGFSYGENPCLAYKLVITRDNDSETKSLNACKTTTGSWISITSGSTTL